MYEVCSEGIEIKVVITKIEINNEWTLISFKSVPLAYNMNSSDFFICQSTSEMPLWCDIHHILKSSLVANFYFGKTRKSYMKLGLISMEDIKLTQSCVLQKHDT